MPPAAGHGHGSSRRRWPRCPACGRLRLSLGPHPRLHVNADADQAIDVDVRMQGNEAIVDVNFHVRVPPQEAWAVMTDYDHATSFISKLEKSVILSRTDEMLLVSQKGTMGYGPFSVTLE